jgi:hypothetical protein
MKLLFSFALILLLAPVVHSQEIDEDEAEEFWVSIILPMLDKDKDAVLKNVHYPIATYLGELTEKEFTTQYDDILTEEVIYQLSHASQREIQAVEYDEPGDVTYMLVLISSYTIDDEGGDMDGEEMESATVLSFKKYDGVWKLYSVDIAG